MKNGKRRMKNLNEVGVPDKKKNDHREAEFPGDHSCKAPENYSGLRLNADDYLLLFKRHLDH
jgi:hypothetical protein